MALSSLRWFSRGKSGFAGATAGSFDKFEQGSSPKYHVGFRVDTASGDIYRYGHFGATVNRGVLAAQDKSESSLVDTDNVVIAPASAQTTTDGTISQNFLELTKTGVSAGDFEGAKLVITDDTGEGYTYDIKRNTASGDPTTSNIRVELYQPLQVALDATSDISIVANRWHNMEIATSTDDILSGVTCSTISAADNYGWVQTRGLVGILQDGSIAQGDPITISDGTSGAVQTLGGGGTDAVDLTTEAIIGYCADPGDSTGHGVFYINID